MGDTGAIESDINGGGVEDCAVPGMAGAGGNCGTYDGGAGFGASIPDWLNEPIGGGPLETGATGTGIIDPGSGGGTLALGGRAIWPISGTPLGIDASVGGATATGFTSAVGPCVAVSSFTARLI